MNCKLGLALIALVALPAAASAQSTESGEVAVEGSVRPICILGDPTPALVDLGQLSASSGPRTGRIAVIPSQTVILPASYCNFAGSVVSISATALTASDATAPAGFARAVNYTASATGWATGASSATTAALGDGTTPTANGTGATQPLPKVADISLTLSSFTAPGDQILVAGNYSGNVIVTLGPALAGGEN